MDCVGGVDFVPELYVDVTEAIALKETDAPVPPEPGQLAACHLRRHGLRQFMREHTGRRGQECGRAWAEAFREVKTYPAVGSWEMLPGSSALRPSGPDERDPTSDRIRSQRPRGRHRRGLLGVLRASNWQLNTGVIVMGLIVLVAILAPLIAPYPPEEMISSRSSSHRAAGTSWAPTGSVATSCRASSTARASH